MWRFFQLWCASSWTTQNSDNPGDYWSNSRRMSAKSIVEQLGISFMKIWICGSHPRSGSVNGWTRIKNVNGASRVSIFWNFFGAIQMISLITCLFFLSLLCLQNVKGKRIPSSVFALSTFPEKNCVNQILIKREPYCHIKQLKFPGWRKYIPVLIYKTTPKFIIRIQNTVQ